MVVADTQLESNPRAKGAAAAYGSWLCDALDRQLSFWWPAPKENVFLSGNYAPVEERPVSSDLPVQGTLPACLDGEFVRNGPNPYFKPTGGYHLFDGDGMLHGVRIKGGRATYVNRYVRTNKLRQEVEYGRPLFGKLGDMTGYVGVLRLLVGGLRKQLGVLDTSQGAGTGNTALVYHGKQLLALHEGDKPYAVRVLEDGEMETLGRLDYGGRLDHSFTAHPKVDPVTGEMFTFGYNVEANPHVVYHVVSAGGELGPPVPITLPDPVMMHDFAVTERHAVFMDLPLVFRAAEMAKGGFPFRWAGEKPARFGVLPRYAATEAALKWFELPTGFVFHTANAFEEGDEVALFACRYDKIDLNAGRPGLKETDVEEQRSYLYEFRFNMATGAATQKQLGDIYVDFPRINEAFLGRKQRYVYCSVFSGMRIVGVAKYDITLEPQLGLPLGATGGTLAAYFPHGPGRFGSEPVFVPRSSDPQSAPEDDGLLLNFVFDEASNTSDMVVVDARTMSPDPVAVARLPDRIPYGFHGIFVSEEQLQSQAKAVTS